MGAGMIRLGGVAAILMLLATVALVAIAIVNPAMAGGRLYGIASIFVLYTLAIFALLATMGLFNRIGRRGATVPIVWLIVTLIVFFAFAALGNAAGPAPAERGLGLIGILILVVFILAVAAWIWFAIYCIIMGGELGGAWRAAGILHLIWPVVGFVGFIVFIVIVASEAVRSGNTNPATMLSGLGTGGLVIGGITFGLAAIAWICQAVGLFSGASRVSRLG